MCNVTCVFQFQSAPPRRRRLYKLSYRASALLFQSAPPRRRRQEFLTAVRFPNQSISIRASEKEATFLLALSIQHHILFQSAPPRRRRLYRVGDFMFNIKISIRASEKEATLQGFRVVGSGSFQSAPPRRRRLQHIVIPQLSCTYLVSTTFLSAIFSFISQYIVLFFFF